MDLSRRKYRPWFYIYIVLLAANIILASIQTYLLAVELCFDKPGHVTPSPTPSPPQSPSPSLTTRRPDDA
jgi:hypothetical protein